jgi:asparaginyl-tRNA synthetase
MDLLVPRIGELVGGSQREERLDVLEARIRELGQNPDDYWWYLELRKFGTAPHAGFGMGFERLLMLLTGIGNIRDVIPFPRTPRHLEF